MKSIHYMKDTKAFWQERNKAREVLDQKRQTTSYTEKTQIAEKLRSDANLLKRARILSSKP